MDRPPPSHGSRSNPRPPAALGRKRTWLILTLTAAVVFAATSAACYRPGARQNLPDPEPSGFAVGACIHSDGVKAETIDCDDAVPGRDYRITAEVSNGRECGDASLENLTVIKSDQIFCLEPV